LRAGPFPLKTKPVHTMKSTLRSSLCLAATLLGAGLTLHALAQETKPAAPAPLSAEKSVLVTVTAKVTAIDQATRAVTLTGPLGNVVSFTVDEAVKRLNEVAVGDDVTADYYVSIAGEVRAPTADEISNPITVIEGAAKAPAGTSPAGGVLRVYKIVAKVIGLDLPTQTVTLQGPQGNSGSIRMEKLEKLTQLRLNDTVIVTYTEALAVSLQKAPPAAK